MNLFELSNPPRPRLHLDDPRLQKLLPLVLNKHTNQPKKGLILNATSNLLQPKNMAVIGCGGQPRPSTNHYSVSPAYQSEVLQITTTRRRSSLCDGKQNDPPGDELRRQMTQQEPRFSRGTILCQRTQAVTRAGRRFRVTRHVQKLEVNIKDFVGDDEKIGTVKLPYGPLCLHNGLKDLSSPVRTIYYEDQHFQNPTIVILSVDLLLSQQCFWDKGLCRWRPQARNLLNHLRKHTSIMLIGSGRTKLSQAYEKLHEWNIPLLAVLEVQKYSLCYDLTDVLSVVNPNGVRIYIMQQRYDADKWQSIMLPICSIPVEIGLVLCHKSLRQQDFSSLLTFQDGFMHVRQDCYSQIQPNQIFDLENLQKQLKNSVFFKRLSMIRRRNDSRQGSRTNSHSLEEFKERLTTYIKILQSEGGKHDRSQSASFVIGDLIKRNYGMLAQFTGGKQINQQRHEKMVQEIATWRAEDMDCTPIECLPICGITL